VTRFASALLVLACRPAPAQIPPPEPEPPRAPDAIVEARPAAGAAASAGTGVSATSRPAWIEAALADRVEQAFSRRAKRKVLGELLETPDGGVLASSTKTNASVIRHRAVIEDDRTRAQRRPRILCTDWRHVVAAYVDAADFFDVVAAGGVFASAREARPATVDATTVGFHVGAGVIVERLAATDRVRIEYDDSGIEAEGWVDDGAVDIVYEPAEHNWPDAGHVTHILPGKTAVFDAPDGNRFATITPGEQQAQVAVHRQEGKRTLVTHYGWEVQVTGWVATKDVRKPTKLRGSLSGSGSGSIGIGSGELVKLRRGTLLLGPESAEIVGVVTRDSTYPCTDCDSSRPRIKLQACDQSAEAIAVRDDQRGEV
jgi:hypothetical protein